MTFIHPTALVSSKACLASDVVVGPYSVVGEHAVLHKGVKLHSHVVVEGRTTLGEGCEVFPFASMNRPQDLKYKGEPSELIVGKNASIREYVTLQPGTEAGGMKTIIGDHCLFMVSSHVAHDCVLGNHVILSNSVALGGHVTLGDYAIIGGLTGVHQNVHVGEHAMVGGAIGLITDVIPFGIVSNAGKLTGINFVGLKRRGFSHEDRHALRRTFHHLFLNPEGTLQERIRTLNSKDLRHEAVQKMVDFLQKDRQRRLCLPEVA